MLLDRVLAPVERIPHSPAFVVGGQPISYLHFRALLCRTVVHLRQQGIRPGDVVGFSLAQSPLYLIAFLALGWIGASMVPIPPTLRPQDRDEVLRKYGIRALLTSRLEVVPPGCRLVQLEGVGARGDESMDEAGAPAAEGSTPLRLALTSGTTGTPKGVLQTHASFEERVDRMHCDVVDRPVVLPPALHITIAVNLAVHALCKGGTVVFPKSYANEDFFDAIRNHGVTHVALPPANLNLMLPALPAIGPAFPGVRHLRLVGSTPTRVVLEAARRQFSPHVYVPYGLAEVGVVAMATPQMLFEDPTAVGAPEPGVRLELVADGEIRVIVPPMPEDYFGPDAGQRTRFRDGWFYPGDRGHFEDGRLHIDGRVDHIINAGGRKVSPEYVESVLMEYPGVREAAVFPVTDAAGDTRLGVVIVPSGALDWKALRDYANQRLHVTAPVRYSEVASLPRNTMGKLEREALTRLPAEARD
jgi:acyl-coenzyme A synthetase/AMP-(fatty) acid ligase